MKIFLCGDVMLGRGVDQILPQPCDPVLYEEYLHSAVDYVLLAEEANGAINRRVPPSYVWGAALAELERHSPDLRLINLETSVTRSDDYWPKGINYRMSPENASCLATASVQCCALANNHVLDWGRKGLLETLATLGRLGVKTVGAGRNLSQAWAPAVFKISGDSRALVFSCATPGSGAPVEWAATADRPGIALLPDVSDASADFLCEVISREKRPGDVIIVSLHWGSNWDYRIGAEERRFAHRLIDAAGVSILHGHSSHHPKGIEVYRDRLILYGCGDFLNDYEGISGYEDFRGDLCGMYLADVAQTGGTLAALHITPLQIRRLQLVRPCDADIEWLRRRLDRESRALGAGVRRGRDGDYTLIWRR
jgi:poly-gamma-glutamate capsule biosynthesis protein CapA/YwtB (metallophosphatase superfamily)